MEKRRWGPGDLANDMVVGALGLFIGFGLFIFCKTSLELRNWQDRYDSEKRSKIVPTEAYCLSQRARKAIPAKQKTFRQ